MLADFRSRVLAHTSRGETVQVVGLPGMGKIRFGRSLGGFFLDPDLYPEASSSILVDAIKTSEETRLIVIDGVNQLTLPEFSAFFRFLKALRDLHRNQLAYVLLVHQILAPEYQSFMGDFYQVASEHIEFLPPLEINEYDTLNLQLSKKQIQEVAHLSGGIPALVKICMWAHRDKTSLDPEENPKLKAQIESMLAVSSSNPAYAKSRLIQAYLATHSTSIFSAAESRLLNLLLENQGKIVSKDQICTIVYPDVKNRAGISDHALDQLVHRLRTKVKSKYTITTHRGLGYQLSSSSSLSSKA